MIDTPKEDWAVDDVVAAYPQFFDDSDNFNWIGHGDQELLQGL